MTLQQSIDLLRIVNDTFFTDSKVCDSGQTLTSDNDEMLQKTRTSLIESISAYVRANPYIRESYGEAERSHPGDIVFVSGEVPVQPFENDLSDTEKRTAQINRFTEQLKKQNNDRKDLEKYGPTY